MFLQSRIPHYPFCLSPAMKCHSVNKVYMKMLKQLLSSPHSSPSVISFSLISMSNRFPQHSCRKCNTNIQNIIKTRQIKNANIAGFEVAWFALQTPLFSPVKNNFSGCALDAWTVDCVKCVYKEIVIKRHSSGSGPCLISSHHSAVAQ